MQKIQYKISLEVRHGISNVSAAKETELIIQKNLFYTSSLFYAMKQLAISFDLNDKHLTKNDVCNAVENLSEIGQILIDYSLPLVEKLAQETSEEIK